MSNEVDCPFCREDDFDLIGLKDHLLKGKCEIFERVESLPTKVERAAALKKAAAEEVTT